VSFSPDGASIVSGSYDGTVKLWSVESGECVTTLAGHSSRVESVSFSPDGASIVSGSYDGTVKVWSVQPTHYSLKQLQYAHHSLQSWVLEGSAEDNDAPADDGWTVLSEINDDTTLFTEHGYESTWPVTMATTVATGFRHFRIRQTGTNKAGTFELSLTGFELYGSMTTKSK